MIPVLRRVVAALLILLPLVAASPASAADPRAHTASDIPDPQVFVVYQVGMKGDTGVDAHAFARDVRATLQHGRGWSAGGRLWFAEVTSSTQLRIWLAAPEVIAAASEGCSAAYSCRVGRDVYINARRWRVGAATYRDQPLSSYRHYVINHEVGHWLELDHRDCRTRGTPAPVMLQQTMSLDGCNPRVWPLPAEQEAALRNASRLDR